MRLPSVKYADRISKYSQVNFDGLNHNPGAGDGKLWDMKNLTGDHYPLLGVRAPRFLHRTLVEPGGLFAWNKLCWVEQGKFYYDGEEKGEVSPGQKWFGAMGAYVVIFPDKCYYNSQTDRFGSMEAEWTGNALTFCDGKLYDEDEKANCIQCEGVDWAATFSVGDAIFISGCTNRTANNKTDIIRDIDGDKLYFYENAFSIADGETTYTEEGDLRISRTVPDLAYVCEQDNRLWGCTQDTIYCSKPGDIFNWNVYDGLDSDAWAVTPTSPGAFTGAISYGGYPLMFKEDHLYKNYGSVPSNFSCVDSASTGVAKGSGNSLAVAGETLFWLSQNGIVAYTGGVPQSLSAAFGSKRFKDAVGASDGRKYYVCMCDEVDEWGVYVYDTRVGLWYKEDDLHITHAARLGRCVYMLDDQGQIWVVGAREDMPEGVEPEKNIPWMMETTDFTEGSPNTKHVGKLQIRMELDDGASAQVWLQYDSDGVWNRVGQTLGGGTKRSYRLPIKPRRCDHYRIKITGTGNCRIHSLAREVAPGSERDTKTRRY